MYICEFILRRARIAACLTVALTLGCGTIYSQSNNIDSLYKVEADSLKRVLSNGKEDSNKINALLELVQLTLLKNNYRKADSIGHQALALSQKINFKKGVASASSLVGDLEFIQGNYPQALINYLQSLTINDENGNKKGSMLADTKIAGVYVTQENLPDALKYYQGALKIAEDIGNKVGIGTTCYFIGNILNKQGNQKEALDYLIRGSKALKETGNKDLIGVSDLLMSNIYLLQTNYKEALRFASDCLKIFQETNNVLSLSSAYMMLAQIYSAMGNTSDATKNYRLGIEIAKEMGNKSMLSRDYLYFGNSFMKPRNFQLAKRYLDTARALALEIRDKGVLKETYQSWAALDSAMGNYNAAFEDYKTFILYQDSLKNEENTKKIVSEQMTYEFEKKEAAVKAEQDKKDAIADQERKKQLILRNSFIAGFALVLSLAFFIFRGYRQKQRANEVITKQKEEVEKQKEIVESQKDMVEKQKALVEEKNKEILDSITYAKRLQDAILPPLSIIKKYLPESFVLYKPKDIVAGDFYWMEKSGNNILIAACDCTGHGVPGAMVSVVCSNALNRTVKEFNITEPGRILDKVRELVLETFEKSEGDVKDGMDVSLCCINTNSREVQWSGAYNPLWYIHNNELNEVSPDKQPIGMQDKPFPFNTHALQLKKGDTLYLFTDGYADQFGGPNGKKFKYKKLQELLLTHVSKSMEEQKNTLEQTIEEWKGSLEQVDDVLVIGVRV